MKTYMQIRNRCDELLDLRSLAEPGDVPLIDAELRGLSWVLRKRDEDEY